MRERGDPESRFILKRVNEKLDEVKRTVPRLVYSYNHYVENIQGFARDTGFEWDNIFDKREDSKLLEARIKLLLNL
jgi:hypothetical protein